MNDTIKVLTEAVRGRVITPLDADYDDARVVYNGMHDRKPHAVIQCMDSADVMAAVAAGRDGGIDLAVRGGGHSVPGFGTVDDGLVIDLSPMKNVWVDPNKRVVRVGGGATWGDVDHATYPFGLAAPGGIISTTGVGGLTLGGGIGYLTRGVGLSIDNLLSADVVLADGRQVTASDYQHEDLFWALRGGGGNFGVVTSFQFQLHEVGDIVGRPDVLRGRRCRRGLGVLSGVHRRCARTARMLLRLADRSLPCRLSPRTVSGICFVHWSAAGTVHMRRPNEYFSPYAMSPK